MSFSNKTVIITGAAQGIGFEIAKQLVEKGANIVLNDLDANLGTKAIATLNQYEGKAIFVQGDCGDLSLIDELFEKGIVHFDKIDFVIANAGITTYGPFLDYTKEAFDQLIHVNIQGTFFLAQKAAKQLIKQNTGGRMLLISSITAMKPHSELEAYGMTKAAINFLAKALGTQLAPYGITVNSITPGATATERTTSTEGFSEGWAELIPTRKISETKDIASTALFLLSDGARQITGQNLIVDGGWNNTGPLPKAI